MKSEDADTADHDMAESPQYQDYPYDDQYDDDHYDNEYEECLFDGEYEGYRHGDDGLTEMTAEELQAGEDDMFPALIVDLISESGHNV